MRTRKGVGKKAKWLIALAALSEDLTLNPHSGSKPSQLSARGSETLSEH